jgi:hypothetical protein
VLHYTGGETAQHASAVAAELSREIAVLRLHIRSSGLDRAVDVAMLEKFGESLTRMDLVCFALVGGDK